MMRRLLIACVFWGVISPTSALAADSWVVLPMASRGVDANAVATFGDLVATALANQTGGVIKRGKDVCLDVPCASKVGKKHRVGLSVYGQMSVLGTKIIVNLTAVDVASAKMRGSQRVTVDRVEDLDVVAGRLVDALVNKKPVEKSAKLGTITAQEAKADRRKKGDHGFSLNLGGTVLFDDNIDNGFGTTLGLGYWFEARDFAFQPFLRFTSNYQDENSGSYNFFDVGLMVHYLFGDGDISPMLGAGLMSRLVAIDRIEKDSLGTSFVFDTEKRIDDTKNGLAIVVRTGVLLFRTYETRVFANLDYEGAFVSVAGTEYVHAMNFGLSIIF